MNSDSRLQLISDHDSLIERGQTRLLNGEPENAWIGFRIPARVVESRRGGEEGGDREGVEDADWGKTNAKGVKVSGGSKGEPGRRGGEVRTDPRVCVREDGCFDAEGVKGTNYGETGRERVGG